jgi:hypothetical protein
MQNGIVRIVVKILLSGSPMMGCLHAGGHAVAVCSVPVRRTGLAVTCATHCQELAAL